MNDVQRQALKELLAYVNDLEEDDAPSEQAAILSDYLENAEPCDTEAKTEAT